MRAAFQRDSRLLEVRRAAEVVRSLVGRVGQVDPEAGVPGAIRRQQWSAFNIPLMCAAGWQSQCSTCHPSVRRGDAWWRRSDGRLGSFACGIEYDGHSIRRRVVGVGFRSGIPTITMGCPFLWACTRTVLEQCSPHQRQGPFSGVRTRAVGCRLASTESSKNRRSIMHVELRPIRWDVLDLEELCSKRFLVLQSCPFQMRGRVRQATRQWSVVTFSWRPRLLFILLPFMLFWRRPCGHAKVGKDELCRRFDKFIAGQ